MSNVEVPSVFLNDMMKNVEVPAVVMKKNTVVFTNGNLLRKKNTCDV